jgi:hypothetical protein
LRDQPFKRGPALALVCGLVQILLYQKVAFSYDGNYLTFCFLSTMARTLFLFIGLKSASERSSAKYESKKDVRDYLMRLSLLRQWGIYENSEMQDFSLFRKQQHSQCIFWEYWFIYHYLLLIFILWWWVIFSLKN